MRAKVKLDRKGFFFLHDSLLHKFSNEYKGEVPANVRQKYGFLSPEESTNDQTLPSLRDSIEKNVDVSRFLMETKEKMVIETRYSLYQNYLDLLKRSDEPSPTVGITESLFKVFLVYLGYKNRQAFDEALAKHAPATRYKVWFYTRDFETESFDLSIDFANYPFEVVMKGFHLDHKRPPFKGKGFRKGSNLNLNLECAERSGEEFHFVTNIGNITDPAEPDVMVAAFMGVSTKGIPTCGECLIVKEGDTPFNHEDGMRKIRAMLMLKRNRITVKNSEIRSLGDITANGYAVTDLELIAGNYVVWGEDHTGAWYQSILVIDPDTFEAFYRTEAFYNFPDLNNLRCELTISSIVSKKLCITTKSKINKGREVVSFVMVEFGELMRDNGHIFEAVFITMSRNTGKSVAGHIYMMRTPQPFEVGILKGEKAALLLERFPKLKELSEHRNGR